MKEHDFVGCISCMSTNDLYDLFAAFSDNVETYAKMFETCFDLKVLNVSKYICAVCSQKLEEAVVFKEQTSKNISMLQTIKAPAPLPDSASSSPPAPGSGAAPAPGPPVPPPAPGSGAAPAPGPPAPPPALGSGAAPAPGPPAPAPAPPPAPAVTNFGIHHPPLPPAHSDDEIVEVPYKPKTPEIIDLDEYPNSPQSVKKKKLDILKERGLEVNALPAPAPAPAPSPAPAGGRAAPAPVAGAAVPTDGSRDNGAMQDMVASFKCRRISLGSLHSAPKEKVTFSSRGVTIVAPSLDKEHSPMKLVIKLNEVIRLLVHFSERESAIFLETDKKSGYYIREALGMEDDTGPYYNPMSKTDPHRRIILLSDCISNETMMVFKVLFGKTMVELNSKEASIILIKTLEQLPSNVVINIIEAMCYEDD